MEIPLSAALSGNVPVVIAFNHGGVKSTKKASWDKRSPFMMYDPTARQWELWDAFTKRAVQARGQKTGYQPVQIQGKNNPDKGRVKELAGASIFVARGGLINLTAPPVVPHYRAFQRYAYENGQWFAVEGGRPKGTGKPMPTPAGRVSAPAPAETAQLAQQVQQLQSQLAQVMQAIQTRLA